MNSNTVWMARQGDILLVKTDEEISGEASNSLILITGKMTGNSHKLTNGKIVFTNDKSSQVMAYVIIEEDSAELKHPEHKTIILPKGKYEIRRQREVVGFVED